MNHSKWMLVLCGLFVALLNFGAQAQETPKSEEHKYTLNLVWIVGSVPHQFVWQVDAWPNNAYQSLDSEYLRKRVSNLLANSTIEYWSSDVRFGGEPSYEEVQRFAEFCKTEEVKFIIHPGG